MKISTLSGFASVALGAALWSGVVTAADGVRVSLCDGETAVTVEGLAPGETLEPVRARAVAARMMQTWRRNKGEARWAAWNANVEQASPQARESMATRATQATHGAQEAPPQPTRFTTRDKELFAAEEKKWIDEGYLNFRSATLMGGTIGISCDMCHPDAANTHPETYPKFQSQMKKVALLRDMINWCIEHPLKGKPLRESDPVLRSVEAYILSTRKGVALEPGKH